MAERSWRLPALSPKGLLPLELGAAESAAAYVRRFLTLLLAAAVALTFIGIYVVIYKLGMRFVPIAVGVATGVLLSLSLAPLEGRHTGHYGRLQLRLLQLPQTLRSLIERLLALLMLLISAPTFVVIALLVRFDSRGPIFVRMTRVGRFGRPFSRLTFRTAKITQYRYDEDIPQSKARPAWRVTRLGHVLRQSSLDKLPMLINVIRGEMTLFGEAPQAPDDLLASGAFYLPRLMRRPGVVRVQQEVDWSANVPPRLSNVASYLQRAITEHRYEKNAKLFLLQVQLDDTKTPERSYVLTFWVAGANEPEIRSHLKDLGVSSVDVIAGSAEQSAALIEAAWTAWCDLPHRQVDEPLHRLLNRHAAGPEPKKQTT